MTRSSHLRLAAFLPLVLGACWGERFEGFSPATGGGHSGPPRAFEERACPQEFQAPSWLARRCGVLLVPESRDDAASRQLELQVVLLTPSQPKGEPLVYLPSTPGRAATLDGVTADGSGVLELARSRQLILMDPRGTGFSQPVLRCDDFAACYDHVRQELGAAAESYARPELAADYRDLREALGIEQWSLLGVGYGSRIALDLLRDDAAGARALVLVSPRPLDVDVVSSDDAALYRSLQAVTDDCAANEKCHQRFPHLQETWSSLVGRLDRSEIIGPDGSPVNLRRLLSVFSQWLETDPASFPARLERLAAGELGSAIFATSEQQQTESSRSTALGARLAITCSEYVPQVSRADALQEPAPPWGGPSSVDLLAGACSLFPVPSLAVDEFAYTTSTPPTLILSGHYDPHSPPVWAERLAESLSGSQRLLFRGLSSRPELDLCAGSVVARFLETPSAVVKSTCKSFEEPTGFLTLSDDGSVSPL